jgi:hypothetical protein
MYCYNFAALCYFRVGRLQNPRKSRPGRPRLVVYPRLLIHYINSYLSHWRLSAPPAFRGHRFGWQVTVRVAACWTPFGGTRNALLYFRFWVKNNLNTWCICIVSSPLHVCKATKFLPWIQKCPNNRHREVTKFQHKAGKFIYISRKLFRVCHKPMAFIN